MQNILLCLFVLALLATAVYHDFAKKDFRAFVKNNLQVLLLGLFICAGLTIRFNLFHHQTGDYMHCLKPWYEKLEAKGGYEGIQHFAQFSDYAPAYLYLLAFLAEFRIDSLIGIKLISVAFDAFLAVGGFLLVRTLLPRPSLWPALCFGALFLAPTVMVNSAFWAQCDAIHTSFVFFSILFLLQKKYGLGVLFWGLALCFKLQSIFVMLPFLVLFFSRTLRTMHFLVIPAIYLIVGIPAVLLGADFLDILLVYAKQADNYPHYSLNAASIYNLIPNLPWQDNTKTAGIMFALTMCFLLAILLLNAKNKLTDPKLALLFLLSALLFAYLLPKMHERYFYMSDVLSIVFAFCYRKYWYLSLVLVFCSLASYYPFLFGSTLLELKYLSLLVGGVLLRLSMLCYDEFYGNEYVHSEKA